jgi:hypothetical protein
MPAKLTHEQFTEKARKRHGDRFDYSACRYVNATTKVTIICRTHGKFSVIPDVHTREGSQGGCTECAGNRKKTTAQFIREATKKHKGFYSYRRAKYTGARALIIITCPLHRDFQQTAGEHIGGKGCQKCYDERRIQKYVANADERRLKFIQKSIKKHGQKYDYSFAVYVNNKMPLQIICSTHGIFYQSPAVHLRGGECTTCSREAGGKKRRSGLEKFIARAKEVHGEHYDYGNVIYTTNKMPVIISCPTHGPFSQQPSNHLGGSGCKKCADIAKGAERNQKSREGLIDGFTEVYGSSYRYEKVDYVNSQTKIIVICPSHGEFTVTPANHMFGHGCADCAQERRPDFIDSRVHNDEEYANRPGFLYLLEVLHVPTETKCFKIGLTSRTDPKARFNYARYDNFQLLPYSLWSGRMRDLWEAERTIKAEIKSRSLLISPFTTDYWHWTESFRADLKAGELAGLIARVNRVKAIRKVPVV